MTSPPVDRRPSGRSAFSLLELMLVLAILAALAGFAIPTFDAMVSNRRIGQSIERLQNELLEARVEAMRTGQAQVFRATIHGDSYSIMPWLGGNEDSDASAGATVMTQGGVVETARTSSGVASATNVDATDVSDATKNLERDVLFLGVETLVDARNALEIQKSGEIAPVAGATNTSASGNLSSPLLIYPDGTCTTSQIILADTHGRRMAIQLRGITGRSTSIRLTAMDASSIPTIVSSSTDPAE